MNTKGWPGCVFVRDAGANPLFSPAHPDAQSAHASLSDWLGIEPWSWGLRRQRWTLQTLVPELQARGWRVRTTGGVHRLLARLGFHWNRAREYLHSPDPLYQAKRERIATIWQRVQASGGREVLLYQDECNYYRQPTVSQAYSPKGEQPLARRGYRSDTMTRVCGVLDAMSGRVIWMQAAHLSVPALLKFYRQVAEAYPQAERIWIVQDNNPMHFHPHLVVGLQPQENPFPVTLAPNWPTEPTDSARKRYESWQLPIQLVPLPTYASWCNPIEKLWRKFKQEIIHLHRLRDDLQALRQRAAEFFDQFAAGSDDLLRYVGLSVPP